MTSQNMKYISNFVHQNGANVMKIHIIFPLNNKLVSISYVRLFFQSFHNIVVRVSD